MSSGHLGKRSPSDELRSPTSRAARPPSTKRDKAKKHSRNQTALNRDRIPVDAQGSTAEWAKANQPEGHIGKTVSHITFTWLKQQLQNAWSRELAVKQYIKELSKDKSAELETQVLALRDQTGKVR
jgi:hypothetical protein